MAAQAATSATRLPRPEERPAGVVVIFDGQCRMCTGQIERLARWDSREQLSYLSLHDPEVYRRYPELTHDALMQNMVVVDRAGRRNVGAAGLRVLSREIPRLWPLVPLLHLPGTLPIWQWLYSQVAKRRYRFGRVECDEGTCHLHGR